MLSPPPWTGREIRLRSTIIVVLAVLMLALPTASVASGPYEPNDNINQAAGPLAGGTSYSGAFETTNDEDWFVFYTVGQVQMDIAVTNTALLPMWG